MDHPPWKHQMIHQLTPILDLPASIFYLSFPISASDSSCKIHLCDQVLPNKQKWPGCCHWVVKCSRWLFACGSQNWFGIKSVLSRENFIDFRGLWKLHWFQGVVKTRLISVGCENYIDFIGSPMCCRCFTALVSSVLPRGVSTSSVHFCTLLCFNTFVLLHFFVKKHFCEVKLLCRNTFVLKHFCVLFCK